MTPPVDTPRENLIAAPWHTALVIAALGVNAWTGFHRSAVMRQAASVNRPALYLRTLAVEWLLLALVLFGLWLRKTPFPSVLGERWDSRGKFFRDLGIALAFLVVSIFVLALLGPHDHHAATDPAVKFLMPESHTEKWLWVLLAISAGICEEAVYRGYLQHQFTAFTRNTALGIVIPALMFGASHAYQGLRPALLIALGGLLSGVLTWWRKSVRPSMIAHALQDLLALVVMH